MSRHPIAIVCALAFVAGGVSAFVLEYPPRGNANVQNLVVGSAGDGRASAAEPAAAEGRPVADTPPGEVTASYDVSNSADTDDGVRVGPSDARGGAAGKLWGGRRGYRSAEGPAVDGSRATRRHARASTGHAAPGRQGLAGHTVGGVKKAGAGVKKAGAVIGRTFGKVGGVFND